MILKKALVIQSGGMDSALCLAEAIRKFGRSEVLSVTFSYQQRHSIEIERAAKICSDWGVDQIVLELGFLNQITENALLDKRMKISQADGSPPNTLVVGRNGLMARIGAIHAHSLGAKEIYMGVIGVEGAHSGYRDCSRTYMDKMEEILRIDLDQPEFKIVTPLVAMTKEETMEFGQSLGVLNYLLETTVTCYEGKEKEGCQGCPACKLRNQGILRFFNKNPSLPKPSYFGRIIPVSD